MVSSNPRASVRVRFKRNFSRAKAVSERISLKIGNHSEGD
jgi:hypothetical protein